MCKLLLVALTLNAFAVRAQTTAIVASGVWNVAKYTPVCNYTEHQTWNITYAIDDYSATINNSNKLGPNCQNIGSQTKTCTGFFASPQDLLTTSQFQALLNAGNDSCGNPGNVVQSVTFASPDSVSGTVIKSDGSSGSFQMTRAKSTSYLLSVTKSGTGSGTVTSNPAGINCGSSCSGGIDYGSIVTLTATPAVGSTFAGWSDACTGAGICPVTLDVKKNVTATFNIAPFVATTTGVTAGVITAPIATVTTRITFNAPDVGRTGAVYVTAWVPVNGLGALGISAAANSQLSVTSTRDNPNLAGAANSLHVTNGMLAEMDSSAFVLVQLTASGWQLVVNGQLIPYASGVLGDDLAAQTILNNTDTANLAGAQFCLGYGASAAEMNAAGRIQLVATIPDPNSTSTATGTCLLTTLPVYRFFNNNAGGHFYTINAAEKDTVIQNYNWFRYEGTGFNASPVAQPGMLPVYRFFNNNAGGHFYTINEAEKDTVIQNYNWFRYEGISFYASTVAQPGTLPLYRFFNNNAGGHFYTINEAEKDTVIQNYNWFRYEGVGFYAYPAP